MISSRRLPRLAPAAAAALLALGLATWLFSALRGGSSAPASAPAVATAGTDGDIARARAAIAANPRDAGARARLADAALEKVRETGDPSWYPAAEDAARRGLAIDPRNVQAMDALGTLALARHRFAEGLAWGRRSRAAEPGSFASYGIEGDALVELGRYRAGFAVQRRALELRPDLGSYSRASYVQELLGDRRGAIALMSLAADAGRPGSESRAWTLVQLGLLRLGSGDRAGAERDMRQALAERPGDARALAGLARTLAAAGRLDAAAALAREAIDRVPLPEYPALLAELDTARGRPAAARRDIALVGAMQRLLAANGVRVDLDIALIQADVRRPDAHAIARARAARATRPGVIGDDVLGWVLTRAGRCDAGLGYARRSLRLGTRDALMLFHAGMAAACAGHPAEAAGRLRAALALNPHFSVRWAPVARRTLAGVAS
jgi:tetratricopeptide (TPR) repeat protein